MDFTGERFVPSEAGVIAYEHWHRYAAVAELLAGKRVLDAASGEGYGAALLARHAAEVVGIDSAAEAVDHAQNAYAGQPNLTFQQMTLPGLNFESESFDAVVSFETLEHVADPEASVAEFKRLLRPGGLLIASTPDRTVYSGRQHNRNPFHTHEMDRSEFESICRRHFANVAIVGQRIYVASVIGPDVPVGTPALDCFSLDDGHAVRGTPAIAHPTYLICFCSDAAVPQAAEIPSTLLDNSAAAQDERETIMSWAQTLKQERDLSASLAETVQHERDTLADQADSVERERDALAAENMEFRHELRELQRRHGEALEQMARDMAELRSEGFLGRAVSTALAAVDEARKAEREFILEQVVAPLQKSHADLAAQVAALCRLRALDIEAVRAAVDHDRLMIAGLGRLKEADRLEAELEAVWRSTSWRVTAPIRLLATRLRRRRRR